VVWPCERDLGVANLLRHDTAAEWGELSTQRTDPPCRRVIAPPVGRLAVVLHSCGIHAR
jgi:hypothetical protein